MNEHLDINKLRVVIIKCPYVNWSQKDTQLYFSKMVSLKLKSYCEKHHVGVMPVDTTDFVADHILICSEEEGDLTPILGVKSLDYDRCNLFHIDFTIEAFLRKGGHQKHLKALYSILEKSKSKQEKISYYSSWAMRPEVSRDRPLATYIKKIYTGLTLLHHTHENIKHLLGLGVPKYRTDSFFYTWGFERISYDNHPLENIPFFILGNIDGVFIHLENYSQVAMDCAEEALEFWENRLVIGVNPDTAKEPKPVEIQQPKTPELYRLNNL